MSEGMYERSNMGGGSLKEPPHSTPPATPARPIEAASRPDNPDAINYPSMLAEGLEVIYVPRRGGADSARPADPVKVKDLGEHVSRKCEALLERGKSASEELSWFAALSGDWFDAGSQKRLDRFAKELARSSNQREYFNSEIRPFLLSMQPTRRG